MPILTLIRGLPGSGKSTLAKHMIETEEKTFHFEADMYHYDRDGKYTYNSDNCIKAHEWCQSRTKSALDCGFNVVVSNTFTTRQEIAPYLDIADDTKSTLRIVKCIGEYESIHDVPREVIGKMADRWEDCNWL